MRGSLRSWCLAASCLVVLLPVSGCRRGGGDSEKQIADRLDKTGTVDVLEQAGEAKYEPPADGELDEAQMKMYLAVEERAAKIRQVANQRLEEKTKDAEGKDKKVGFFDALKAMGDAGDLITADLRAAQELGFNPAEFQWVRGKVLEAQVARMGRDVKKQAGAFTEQYLSMLEAQIAATDDESEKADLRQQIADFKKQQEESAKGEDLEPGVAHNIALVEKYQPQIEKLNQRAEDAS